MSDNQQIAETLYAGIAPDASDKAGAAPAENADTDQRDPGGGLYSAEKTYELALKDGLESLADHYGWSNKDVDQERRDIAQVFQELAFTPDEAARTHELYVRHLKNPPDPQTLQAWETETRSLLRQKFGDEAESRLKLAKQYVASRPYLRDLLNDSGCGSKPEVVLDICERALRLKRSK